VHAHAENLTYEVRKGRGREGGGERKGEGKVEGREAGEGEREEDGRITRYIMENVSI
jgi:hypothetical protein